MHKSRSGKHAIKFCAYCSKWYDRCFLHIRNKHKQKIEISKILELETQDQDRQLKKLANMWTAEADPRKMFIWTAVKSF